MTSNTPAAHDAREKEAHFQGMLLAAEAAESIAPSDEWSEDTKTSYIFGARDAARAIRKIAAMSPTPAPSVREAVKAALEAAAEIADQHHDAAVKWAAVYVKEFDGETDSARIATAIRALDPDAIIAGMPAPDVAGAARERMAVAMWRNEAERGAAPSIAARRTIEAFREESGYTQGVWLGYADAALAALAEGRG